MAEQVPDKFLDLFQKPALAHLATVMADGTPQVTPVWVDYDGTYILINTVKGRQKAVNMERRSQVGLDIVDPGNPWHWISVRGRVVEVDEQAANEHIDKMAKKYTGQDRYANHNPNLTRAIYKVLPDRVIGSQA